MVKMSRTRQGKLYKLLEARGRAVFLLCGTLAVMLGLITCLASCAPTAGAGVSAPPVLEPVYEKVTVEEAQQLMSERNDLTILAVGPPEEYEAGCIPGSVSIPLGELEDRLGEIDRAKVVLVYCRVGARSDEACQLLRDDGFSEVYNLKGGTDAWQKAGGQFALPLLVETLLVTPTESEYFKEPSIIFAGKSCRIECIVSGSESSELSYNWSAERGGISGEGSVITWTAPTQSGKFSVTVTVSDIYGCEATGSVAFSVKTCGCVFN